VLPGVSGMELCKRLRGKLPILMGHGTPPTPADIVLGSRAGADDYITKPFEIPDPARAGTRPHPARGKPEPGGSHRDPHRQSQLDQDSHQVFCGLDKPFADGFRVQAAGRADGQPGPRASANG